MDPLRFIMALCVRTAQGTTMEATADRKSLLQETWYCDSVFTGSAAAFIYFYEKPGEKIKIELNRAGAI